MYKEENKNYVRWEIFCEINFGLYIPYLRWFDGNFAKKGLEEISWKQCFYHTKDVTEELISRNIFPYKMIWFKIMVVTNSAYVSST